LKLDQIQLDHIQINSKQSSNNHILKLDKVKEETEEKRHRAL